MVNGLVRKGLAQRRTTLTKPAVGPRIERTIEERAHELRSHGEISPEVDLNRVIQAAALECARALRESPNSYLAARLTGYVRLQTGHALGAIQAFMRGTEVRPRLAEAWSNLGVAYITAGQRYDAVEAWRRALAIEPGNTAARQNLLRLQAVGSARRTK